MKTKNVHIPEQHYIKLKMLSFKEKKTLKQKITEIFEEALNGEKK